MTPRSRHLLHEIVEAYIHTGEPVASRAVGGHQRLSGASIRNLMADLDEQGYLSQPHTSAGRVPTEKAFRSYVESLSLRRLAAAEIERLRSEFGRLDTVEERISRTTRMLTEMTQGVGLAATIPQASPALDRIELIALPDRRVLMVVVTQDRQVRNRVVGLEEPVSAGELESILYCTLCHHDGRPPRRTKHLLYQMFRLRWTAPGYMVREKSGLASTR